ncbi:MAG: stage II sporulation protein E [Bacteroidetes bacterium GWF2_49_14]|nr:MAG: stage II sporulation protein E [Bacteroidetes bacterium GWF2_49_14]
MDPQQFHIEINCQQKFQDGERICGDVFLSQKIPEEGRTIMVLSDGMGHGVKANMLATLTATMALNFTREHKDVEKIAEIIMNTLPVCSERKISYATFTVLDIEDNGLTRILEFDNPHALIFRGDQMLEPEWNCIIMTSQKNAGREILTCSFRSRKEDRIVLCTDGVVQSGMGYTAYPFGWDREKLADHVHDLIVRDPEISARKLGTRIVNVAVQNDKFKPQDDTSCATVYFREPRKLLICTGPPYEKDKDAELAGMVRDFPGRKILCGATTADIIARELDKKIIDSLEFTDPELPPVSHMEGIDLITEGILTLGKVSVLLEKYQENLQLTKGPADEIIKMILQSDEVHFIIGTRINIAHQDPSLPVELEIRRTVVKRIARILEKKFLLEIRLTFI